VDSLYRELLSPLPSGDFLAKLKLYKMKILGETREDKSFVVFLRTKGKCNQGLHFKFKWRGFVISKDKKKRAVPLFDIECLESQM
jgi:hypothetical protein